MPRILTLPPSAAFLPELARALLDGALVPGFAPRGDPMALAGATIFLPTRRAGRLFAEALLAEAGGDALLLPRILPLGDVDEDALAFSEDAPTLAAPLAVSPVHRRLVLARLVGAWRDSLAAGDGRAAVAAGPAATFALADALARLFDDLTTAAVPPARLDALGPEEHDDYFRLSLDFVRIARAGFADYLAAAGCVEPAVRRDALVLAEARRLDALGPDAGPVIAAGSTGSLPATAQLLKTVSRLPQGAVVLPGLDLHLEDAAFARLADPATGAPDHPQYGLARLLRTLEATRADVRPLAPPAPFGRERLASEAMREAETTDLWASLDIRLPPETRAAALDGIAVVAADDPREEALCVAVALRETLATPGATAALVTPDRDLARRVAGEMARFGLVVDDSAGTALAETGPGRLARHLADAAAQGLAPVALFALVSHPGAGFGLDPAAKARAVAALELAALRGPRPRLGIAGLAATLDAFDADRFGPADPRSRLDGAAIAAARDLVERIAATLGPLLALDAAGGAVPLADLVAAHRSALESVAGPLDPDAEDPAEAALAAAFAEVAEVATSGPAFTLADYAEILPSLLGERIVRPLADPGARVRILGPLEARLVGVDRMVLGALAEGTWPQQQETDPWLSRPMRTELGLDLPERRIGLSAHDFVQGLGAREVVLTYAAKVGGAQQVRSRFLHRLETVAGPALWAEAKAKGERLRTLARALDVRPPVPRATRPAPAPPMALRPRRLSVSDVETLLRDPYSIYARHILGLAVLDGLDEAPGAAERGTALHAAGGAFPRDFPDALPEDARGTLLAYGRAAFAPLEAFPAEHAIWWARFSRAADFLVAFERARRPELAALAAEVRGRLELSIAGAPFHLVARADRIEARSDGRLAILDFKTGTAPTPAQAASLAPQLTLEAAMAARGAFADIPAAEVADIAYVELKGSGEGGAEKPVRLRNRTTMDLAETALSGLTGLLTALADEAQGYRALAAPQWRGRFGDYDHLARVREWALGGEEAE